MTTKAIETTNITICIAAAYAIAQVDEERELVGEGPYVDPVTGQMQSYMDGGPEFKDEEL